MKFSYWPLLPTKQPSALVSTPSAVQLPRRGGFALFPALIWLRHPLPLSKQLIQSMSLICQPLDRSKGLFCSGSPRELPSLFLLLLPFAERSPCSCPGYRELSQQDHAARARGRGFWWGAAASSILTDLPVRAWWLQRHTGRHVVPGFRDLPAITDTALVLFAKSYSVLFLLFTLYIITDVTVH